MSEADFLGFAEKGAKAQEAVDKAVMDARVGAGYQPLPNEVRGRALGVGVVRKGEDPPAAVFIVIEVDVFGNAINVSCQFPPEEAQRIIDSLVEGIRCVKDGDAPSGEQS